MGICFFLPALTLVSLIVSALCRPNIYPETWPVFSWTLSCNCLTFVAAHFYTYVWQKVGYGYFNVVYSTVTNYRVVQKTDTQLYFGITSVIQHRF